MSGFTEYVGRTPAFQRIGKTIGHAMTPQQAQKLAFDWEVETFPLLNASTMDVVTTHKGTQRNDGNGQLGIVGKTYGLLYNQVLVDLATATGLNVESAGTTDNGRRVWMLLDSPEAHNDFGGDPHKRYIFLSTTHDGSGSLSARAINQRIYCANQFPGLTRRNRAEVTIRHTSNAMNYVAEARRIMTRTNEMYAEMDLEIQALLTGQTYGGTDGMLKLALQVYGERPEDEGRKLTTWENRMADLVQIHRSKTVENIASTDYGAVMTINEWELGKNAKNPEAEAKRILAGLTDTNKAAAIALEA